VIYVSDTFLNDTDTSFVPFNLFTYFDMPLFMHNTWNGLQYSQRHSVITHCDRRITFLIDTDISFILSNISSKFLLHLECYLTIKIFHRHLGPNLYIFTTISPTFYDISLPFHCEKTLSLFLLILIYLLFYQIYLQNFFYI
jgi:hypothetical protein